MIEPTVGRIVHYFLANVHDKPHAALLVGVNSERNINLAVFNDDGSHFRAVSVPLLQDQDMPPENAPYAGWMVYQKGQAAKTEALQAAATAAPGSPTAPAVDLAPVHEKLAQLEASVTATAAKVAAPAVDVEAKFAELAESKFQELGTWLTKTIGDFHTRLNAMGAPPAPPVPPIGENATQHPVGP